MQAFKVGRGVAVLLHTLRSRFRIRNTDASAHLLKKLKLALAGVVLAATPAWAQSPENLTCADVPKGKIVRANYVWDTNEPPREPWRLVGLSNSGSAAGI